jgi:hypothetical protein
MSHAQTLIRPQGTSQQARCAGPDTVKATLTSKRRRRLAENDAFAAFVRRILRAYARRIAAGDVEAIFQMTNVAVEFDTLIGQAVNGLHTYGYSWAEIASRLGITRQAAWQRWGGTP